MNNEVLLGKASLHDLNQLHNKVAQYIADNLDDPKVLACAIKFLKDNDIVVDVVTQASAISITDSLKKIQSVNNKNNKQQLTVEELLELE